MFATNEEAQSAYREINTIVTMADKEATREDVFINFYNACQMIREGGSISDYIAEMGLSELRAQNEIEFEFPPEEDLPF